MKQFAPDQQEVRTFAVGEVRAESAEGKTKIAGYAAKFNSLSEDLGGFFEIIAPGCFARAIKEDDVRAVWNHDSNIVLGRNKSGTLTLVEDATGLHFECVPPDTDYVKDVCLTPISRGDVSQCSFRFRTLKDSWAVDGEGRTIRTLLEVSLSDVCPVTYPAYRDTDVAVRSMKEAFKQPSQDYVARNSALRRRLDLSL
jgi:HK97 family phage prohead protease